MRFQAVSKWREEGALVAVPARRGIFRIEFSQGPPYIGKTSDLRRRLRRLLRRKEGQPARLTLREIATGVHFRLTGSTFESDLALYRAVRRHRPGDQREYLKLRPASYVKVLMGNRFPRTCLTSRLTRSRALFYGPFPSRNAAEQFRNAFLDLFGVRRCRENLDPSPGHPGCIWGEMDLCLRPCQAACDDSRYAGEVERMALFLRTDGESLLREAAAARDRASASMEFELAAQHHRTWSKAKDALRMRGDLSREIGNLCGVVLQRSAAESSLELTPLFKGAWQPSFRVQGAGERSVSALGNAIRGKLAERSWQAAPPREREDHLALLLRWHCSSFRKGEFVPLESFASPPVRRLANAAARVALGRQR